jgi:hypothetical protein
MTDWKRLSECVRVASQRVTLIGERWLCDNGQELEYWRIKKADSVIVLPLQAGHLFLRGADLPAWHRPSHVGFPRRPAAGGRLAADKATNYIVPFLPHCELGIAPDAARRTEALNAAKLGRQELLLRSRPLGRRGLTRRLIL